MISLKFTNVDFLGSKVDILLAISLGILVPGCYPEVKFTKRQTGCSVLTMRLHSCASDFLRFFDSDLSKIFSRYRIPKFALNMYTKILVKIIKKFVKSKSLLFPVFFEDLSPFYAFELSRQLSSFFVFDVFKNFGLWTRQPPRVESCFFVYIYILWRGSHLSNFNLFEKY